MKWPLLGNNSESCLHDLDGGALQRRRSKLSHAIPAGDDADLGRDMCEGIENVSLRRFECSRRILL
jgi:hypothetical protein